MPTAKPLNSSSHDALRRAVEFVGSQVAFARLLGVSQPTVWKWLTKFKPLPAEHVLAVEDATGIPKEQLRPDLYRADETVTAPAGGTTNLEQAQ